MSAEKPEWVQQAMDEIAAGSFKPGPPAAIGTEDGMYIRLEIAEAMDEAYETAQTALEAAEKERDGETTRHLEAEAELATELAEERIRCQTAEQSLAEALEALREAADDLGKAANQFESIRRSQAAGHNPEVSANAVIFASKAARADLALSNLDPTPGEGE